MKLGMICMVVFLTLNLTMCKFGESSIHLLPDGYIGPCSAPHFLDTKKLILNVLSPPICFFVPMVFEFDRRQIT